MNPLAATPSIWRNTRPTTSLWLLLGVLDLRQCFGPKARVSVPRAAERSTRARAGYSPPATPPRRDHGFVRFLHLLVRRRIGSPLASSPSRMVALPPIPTRHPLESRVHQDNSGNVAQVGQGKVPTTAPRRSGRQRNGPGSPSLRSASRSSRFNWARRTGFGPGIAPRIPSAIIGTDSGESRDARLHQDPVKGEIPQPVLDDNGRTARPCAIDVEPDAPLNDEVSGRLRLREAVPADSEVMLRIIEQASLNIAGVRPPMTEYVRRSYPERTPRPSIVPVRP